MIHSVRSLAGAPPGRQHGGPVARCLADGAGGTHVPPRPLTAVPSCAAGSRYPLSMSGAVRPWAPARRLHHRKTMTKAWPGGCYRCVDALFGRARKWYYFECCSGPRRLRLRFQRLQLGPGVFLIPRALAVSATRYGQSAAGLPGEFLPATICLHDRSLRTPPGHQQRSRYGRHRMDRCRPGRRLDRQMPGRRAQHPPINWLGRRRAGCPPRH